MKIIVLAGGLSTERVVSLSSGHSICKTLREMGHDAFLLDAYFGLPHAPESLEDVFSLPDGGLDITEEIGTEELDLEKIKASRPGDSKRFLGPNVIQLCQMADITFLGLHGDVGENGKIQATFDILGIRYTGPNYLGCALSMDKGVTKKIFLHSGIPSPKGFSLHKLAPIPVLKDHDLTCPVVVKPCSGGSSIGVYICHTQDEYKNALISSFQKEDEVVVEEYIKGREFGVGLLDGTPLPVIEIVPKNGWFDYKNKYQSGCTDEICPANIPEETAKNMQELAVRAFHALKLDIYSRADFLLTEDGRMYCLEVNSLPGMTSASLIPKEAKAYGMDYPSLCQWIVDASLKRYHNSFIESDKK